MIIYVDASAAAKLLTDEVEADALAAYLDAAVAGAGLPASCSLLETELRRLAQRTGIEQALVTEHLDRYAILEPDASLFRFAGLIGNSGLRSLDALHVAAAIRLDAGVMLSYDKRQLTAATQLGLRTVSPS